MIISKTPYRVSFFGGGLDHQNWFSSNKTKVLSCSIDKYSYISLRDLPSYFNYKYRLRYYLREEVNYIKQIKHPVIKKALTFLKINRGIDLVHSGDIPAMSGVGTSSAFTVGLLKALIKLNNKNISKKKLALKSIYLEQKLLKENVGWQDQIASTYGGLNQINFYKNDFKVIPLNKNKDFISDFTKSMYLCYTGIPRNSNNIAKTQISSLKSKKQTMKMMSEITNEASIIFRAKNFDYMNFGKLLHEYWFLKKELNPNATNKYINLIYEKAIKSGALGGKILGAGAGGFFLFIIEPNKKDLFKKKMKGFLHIPFNIDEKGSTIIHTS